MQQLETRKSPSRTRILMMTSAVALMAASSAITSPAFADEAAAKKWIDSEFQPSTLSKEDQMKEMQWFIKAAEPFKGMEINAVSETLTVHEYESKTLFLFDVSGSMFVVDAVPEEGKDLKVLPCRQDLILNWLNGTEDDAGRPNFERLRAAAASSKVETVGRPLRQMMSWLDAPTDREEV